jgi:polyphosphate kinase
MPRNFDRHVEAVAPIETPALHERVRMLLRTYLDDERMAWDLGPDGTWTQRNSESAARPSHEVLIKQPWGVPRETPAPARETAVERQSEREPVLGD